MPQKRSLLNKPESPKGVNLPEHGDDNIIDKAMRALLVAAGVEDQEGGDIPGAIGGMLSGGTLGGLRGALGKALKFPKPPKNVGDTALREHLFQSSPKLRNEFDLMNQVPSQSPLEHDEIRKMLDLLNLDPTKR